jgi:hypothetical protein
MGMATTERIALPAPVEPPSPRLQPFSTDPADKQVAKRERAERQIILARSTLIGICLTAFACGIVTTVALDRHHFRALEHELLAPEAEQAVVPPPSGPAPEVVAEVPAQAPAPEPVVVQMAPPAPAPVAPGTAVDQPAKPAAESNKLAEEAKPTTARVAVARTPRPAAAPRPSVHHKPAAPAASTDPAPTSPNAGWVDPFAE